MNVCVCVCNSVPVYVCVTVFSRLVRRTRSRISISPSHHVPHLGHAPAPPKAGTGGVDVSADGGAIVAARCAYEGSGIVKSESLLKIADDAEADLGRALLTAIARPFGVEPARAADTLAPGLRLVARSGGSPRDRGSSRDADDARLGVLAEEAAMEWARAFPEDPARRRG